MEQIYYRIVKDFVGENVSFSPQYAYEQVRLVNGIYEEVDTIDKIKEVCFAKSVEGCLFAINMFLKEGYYHIYQTNTPPSLDLSYSGIGDFPAIQEVRYQETVPATYVGKIYVTSFLLHCLEELYEQSNMYKPFNYQLASKELERFSAVNDEIIYYKGNELIGCRN
jgi:hypothetical protein